MKDIKQIVKILIEMEKLMLLLVQMNHNYSAETSRQLGKIGKSLEKLLD